MGRLAEGGDGGVALVTDMGEKTGLRWESCCRKNKGVGIEIGSRGST